MEGPRLNLTDLRRRHRELLAYFVQIRGAFDSDAETAAQNHLLARRKRGQRLASLLPQVLAIRAANIAVHQGKLRTATSFSHANNLSDPMLRRARCCHYAFLMSLWQCIFF